MFAGADAGTLRIYYTGDTAAWASFVPEGNPTVPVVKKSSGGPG